MILFVFEGRKTEPALFKTLEYLYFNNPNEKKVCCFGYNIYELYRLMTESDFTEDIVTVIKRKLESRNEKPISDELSITDFSEVYLFFDYDFQNKNLELEELNAQLNEMIEFFSDETDNGKLYVSYPMIESIKCTQKLPDEHFFEYKASRADCSDFKNYVSTKYTYYKSTDFMQFTIDKKTNELRPISKEREASVKENWKYLKEQNIKKANYICYEVFDYPENKESINQKKIFNSELAKYVQPKNEVSILNAFPLFLFEYFK